MSAMHLVHPELGEKPEPPKHLKLETQRWWSSVYQGWDLDQHDEMRLTAAAEFWDLAEKARKRLEKYGLTFTDRFGQPRSRPEVKIQHDAKLGFFRALRELKLDPEEVGKPGRPAGGIFSG